MRLRNLILKAQAISGNRYVGRRSSSFPDVSHVSGVFIDDRIDSLLLCLYDL